MPRYGLMSDTHGQSATAQRAVAVLLRQKIDAILHMGDVGSESVIDALAVINPKTGKQVDAHLVFGNTDFDADELGRYAASLGMHEHHPAGTLESPGVKLTFTHGDRDDLMNAALDARVTYLCHGHTHAADRHVVGATTVINPGALFRAPRYTVAVLDTDDASVTFHEVTRE
jgi:putative phosphoesterase